MPAKRRQPDQENSGLLARPREDLDRLFHQGTQGFSGADGVRGINDDNIEGLFSFLDVADAVIDA